MAAETQYLANTGLGQLTAANTGLDGSGTLVTVLTASTATGKVGCLIKSVTIKAATTVVQGMVRLFIVGGGSNELIAEIQIPATTPASDQPSFELYMPLNYVLKSGYSLKATTQNGSETINVIAEGLDWNYYATSVRPESTNYTANTGMVNISTANAGALDGTGATTVLTAASNGTQIQSITIKGTTSTTAAGMVRLFIYDGTNTRCIAEVPVPIVTITGTSNAFSHRITFGGNGFALQSGYILKASTEKANSFNIIAEGLNWAYPA